MGKNALPYFLMMFLFALVWVATDRFAPGTQELIGSTDVTVRATAPTVDDDIDLNFLRGYVWIDTVGGAVYIAEDVTDGAAVWTDITAGGSTFNAEEVDALIAANVGVLDFGAGFDLTESPAGEVNVVLDYTEDPVNLSGAEVTGTLDLSDHVNLTAGTGATLTGDSLSVDLGVAIDTTEITDGTILEADLAAVDTAVDEECLTFETTTGDFEWQTCGAGDGVGYDEVLDEGSGLTQRAQINFTGAGVACVDNAGATRTDCTIAGGAADTIDIEEDNVLEQADASELDFGTGFDVSCSAGECDVTVNLGDDIDLTAEVTGTLPVGNGGTGQTAATADGVMVGNGSAFVVRVVPDCDASGAGLHYDITTDAFTCETGHLLTVDISADTNLSCGAGCTLTGDEISVDTVTYTKSFVLGDPVDADSILMWEAPANLTITSWSCIVDPGDSAESVVADLRETDATGDSGVTIDGTVTCDNDEANDDGSLSNPTIDAGDYLLIDIGTVTGTVSWLSVTWLYTLD